MEVEDEDRGPADETSKLDNSANDEDDSSAEGESDVEASEEEEAANSDDEGFGLEDLFPDFDDSEDEMENLYHEIMEPFDPALEPPIVVNSPAEPVNVPAALAT